MAYITGHPDVDKYLLFKMLDYKTLSILNSANKYAKRNIKRLNIAFETNIRFLQSKLIKVQRKRTINKLVAACSKGSLSLAKFLLNTLHHNIDFAVHKQHDDLCGTNGIVFILNNSCKQSEFQSFDSQKLSLHEAFLSACINGHIHIMQWLWNITNKTIDIHADNERAFTLACNNEHLDIMQWLWDISEHTIDFHVNNNDIFGHACILRKRLDVAKWIWNASNGNIDKSKLDYIFHSVCWIGKTEACEWLFSVADSIDTRFDDDRLFHDACSVGDLGVAKFLWKISNNSIRFDDRSNKAFVKSCERNDIQMAQYIYGLWEVSNQSVHMINDYLFIRSCLKNNKDIAEWFCTLSDNYSIVCVGNRIVPVIKSYVAIMELYFAMFSCSCLAIYLASRWVVS